MACEQPLTSRPDVAAALRREGMRADSAADVVYGALRALDEADPYGEDAPAVAAQRRILTRYRREAAELFAAADEYERCGTSWVYHECRDPQCPGVAYTVRRCGRATICPDCARAAAGRLRAIYTARVKSQLAGALKGVRARLVTLALRPREVEDLPEAFVRCRRAGKLLLRVLYGVPASRREWALYFQLVPLTAVELRAGPRAAAAGRRRRVRADRLRQAAGWLIASEFGERGMKAHVHALVVGRYVPQAVISRGWRLLTGSFMADVRLARDVGEVTKYPVKFLSRTPAELASLYRATCGRRRIEAVGSLRGARYPVHFPLVAVTPRERPACPCCGGPLRAVGIIPAELWAMGVRAALAEHQFKPKRRGPAP